MNRFILVFVFALLSHPVFAKDIGGRPAGCPARYCGCAVAKYLGIPNHDGRHNLAAYYLRYPRARPAPRMVAARRGHVFVILQVLEGNRVLAYDPNSGRGRTRIHNRSLSGFIVVNPGRGNTNLFATAAGWHGQITQPH